MLNVSYIKIAMSSRVLITGASGLLGRVLVEEFDNQCWDVLGLAYSRAGGVLKKVDLRDRQAVVNVLKEFKPTVVVHAAIERNPDVCENKEDEARKVNVSATETIAQTCAEIGAFLILISTCYVFDGTKPPYKPSDSTNPLMKYAATRVDGERKVQEYHPSSVILRIPVLYGPVEYLKESSVTCLFEPLLNCGTQTMICDWQIGYPTYTKDVAVICRQIADKYLQDPSFKGIFHWSSTNNGMTKYEMVTTMADIFSLSHDHLTANKNPPSGPLKPHNSQLDISDLEILGVGHMTPFREGIKACLQPHIKK